MPVDPSGGLVAVIAIVIFLIIVFWRVAIPLILAILLAKMVIALASIVPQGPPPVAMALLTTPLPW